MRTIRIGSGAGYGGDRVDPAVDLMREGALDYIGFECLAERTIALAHEQMLRDPTKGYNELLETRMEKALPLCRENGVKIVTNMGQANPLAALAVVRDMAARMGLSGISIAAVIGDDIFGGIDCYLQNEILESGGRLFTIRDTIISANAYIGASGIVEALGRGADVVIAGRVSDPSLFLAPLIHEFGWTEPDAIGKGILVGHLLECAAQVTGGYFADPGYKEVPDLWRVGFPIAEVTEDGNAVITKLPGSGGMVTRATVTEQILYEIHDPACYITPDGIADYTGVTLREIGRDRVLVSGARGRRKSGQLKVSVGYKDCWIGEGEISYGGPGAIERSRLAEQIVRKRLRFLQVPMEEMRVDHIGMSSLFGGGHPDSSDAPAAPEVRLRVAGRTTCREHAEAIGNEVEALYLNGPMGGGGARKYVRDVISIASILIPERDVKVRVIQEEV